MKVVSGHQPVYLPWLGLLHKASLADVFIQMDDVQYLEKDWNNRNKIKTSQGKEQWLTVPVDLKSSASNLLKDIRIFQEPGPVARRWQARHWTALQSCYGKAPFFAQYRPFFEDLYLGRTWESLAELNLAILKQAFAWFNVSAEIVLASTQGFTGKKSDLVLEHAVRFKADVVVTGALGKDYIREDDFRAKGVRVRFQDYKHPTYEQRFGGFLPRLSFVDLLFQHGPASPEIAFAENWTREDLCRPE
ncbi:MAG: WbqC family protein [Elusimicrobiota bacterium]